MISRFLLVISCLVFWVCGSANAELNFYPPASTTVSGASRYEVVQSNLAAKWTFLLDRYEGRVYQLVVTKDEINAWEGMLVVGSPVNYNKPSYQIFASGIAARHTFLIDTETGATWTLATQKGKEGEYNIWAPFAASASEARKTFEKLKGAIFKDIVDASKEK